MKLQKLFIIPNTYLRSSSYILLLFFIMMFWCAQRVHYTLYMIILIFLITKVKILTNSQLKFVVEKVGRDWEHKEVSDAYYVVVSLPWSLPFKYLSAGLILSNIILYYIISYFLYTETTGESEESQVL